MDISNLKLKQHLLMDYKDITSISPFEARFEVLLQCGELFVFSTTDNVERI